MNDDEKRECITYRIRKDFGPKSNVYRIDKVICELEVECYHVTINPINDAGVGTLWCDCPGFRRQTYDKTKHKHVVLAFDFRKRGEPEGAVYTIEGTGRTAEVIFLRSDDETR